MLDANNNIYTLKVVDIYQHNPNSVPNPIKVYSDSTQTVSGITITV